MLAVLKQAAAPATNLRDLFGGHDQVGRSQAEAAAALTLWHMPIKSQGKTIDAPFWQLIQGNKDPSITRSRGWRNLLPNDWNDSSDQDKISQNKIPILSEHSYYPATVGPRTAQWATFGRIKNPQEIRRKNKFS